MQSASLFGALAGSGALPLARAQFEQTIRDSGRGVDASLKAFAAAFDLATGSSNSEERSPASYVSSPHSHPTVTAPKHLKTEWDVLSSRIDTHPEAIKVMARAGLTKVVDYQNIAYGKEYLDRLDAMVENDQAHGGVSRKHAFSTAFAKHLANAMCYDDVIRVADLKTRSSRHSRVRDDVNASPETIVHITEFMHPRAEEIIGLCPTAIGRYIFTRKSLLNFLDRRINRGRRLRTDAVGPFLMLYSLGGLCRWRRYLLRHQQEVAHTEAWVRKATQYLNINYDLAVETLNARRLIKGYSNTHARGLSTFDRVMDAITLVERREDAADWANRLITAALGDVNEHDLEGVNQTIHGFADDSVADDIGRNGGRGSEKTAERGSRG